MEARIGITIQRQEGVLTLREFDLYTHWYAMALARSYARSGDAAQISGYQVSYDLFTQAIAFIAEAYVDQAERDHVALLAAIKECRIQTELPVSSIYKGEG